MTVTDAHVSGGVEIGGTATVSFEHGSAAAETDLVLEWDFDNDGDFDQPEETITGYLVAGETLTGRDWPSQLTGRAGPGRLQAVLRNDDDRFSFFNAGSPLNQGANSLRTGRKIRLRTATAPNPDPPLLARDRFLGSGELGADEVGNPWTAETTSLFTRQSDSSGANMAVPGVRGGVGSIHTATVDVGTADGYLQLRWRHIDKANTAGLVYRWEDISNYGLVTMTADELGGRIEHGTVSGGSLVVDGSLVVEYRADDFLGVLVDGTALTVYHNGAPVITGATAFTSSATEVGIDANWNMQRPPSIREFYAWDGLPAETEGILWTGDVTRVTPSVALGPNKTVTVEAEGRLASAAGHDVSPPNSIGPTGVVFGFDSPGTPSGVMVGATLGRAGLLHPPGAIAEGDLTLGAVGIGAGKALEIMRGFEEAEFGFLHESQEGYIDFDDRSARSEAPVVAVFSDQPGTQFGYSGIELLDWRGEIVNRVEAGIGPKVPRIQLFAFENTAVSDVIVPMPDLVNGAAVGDLFLVVIAASAGVSGVNWLTPVGWTAYRDAQDQLGRLRIYAKVIAADDIDDDVTFLDTNVASGDFVSFQLLIKDFYGDLQQGLAVSDIHGFGQPSSLARAHAGDNDPPAVFPSWAPNPSTVITLRGGMTGSGIDVDDTADEFYAPNGFANMFTASTGDVALQIAFLNTNELVMDPSPFGTNPPGGAAFNNFDFVETVTIAIRGFAGDPPEVQGGQLVTVDDFASQERHRAVRSHSNPARFFAGTDDAEAYCEAVLITYADDRPICSLSFVATTNAAYRNQAIRRRVGHKIHVVANNSTGLGIDRDFFIENINHRFDDAASKWTVTWQLSPA